MYTVSGGLVVIYELHWDQARRIASIHLSIQRAVHKYSEYHAPEERGPSICNLQLLRVGHHLLTG